MKKKPVLIIGIVGLVLIILSGAYYFNSILPHQKAVESYNTLSKKVKKQNKILENKIDSANTIIKENARPLEERTLEDLKTQVESSQKRIKKVPKIKTNTVDIKKQIKELKKEVDYSTDIKSIVQKIDSYSTSVQQLKQITNPTNIFIEERLKEIDTITGVQSVTETNDKNELLNKQGGYTASVYFTDNEVTEEVDGRDIVEKGNMAGGNVEVYKTVAEAKKRDDYLSAFDGTPTFINAGSHYIFGTIIIRTSPYLTASQQQDLTNKIYKKLIEIRKKGTKVKSEKTKKDSKTSSDTKNSSSESVAAETQPSSNNTTQPSSSIESETSTSSSGLTPYGRGGAWGVEEDESNLHSNFDENGYNSVTGKYWDEMVEEANSGQITSDSSQDDYSQTPGLQNP